MRTKTTPPGTPATKGKAKGKAKRKFQNKRARPEKIVPEQAEAQGKRKRKEGQRQQQGQGRATTPIIKPVTLESRTSGKARRSETYMMQATNIHRYVVGCSDKVTSKHYEYMQKLKELVEGIRIQTIEAAREWVSAIDHGGLSADGRPVIVRQYPSFVPID